MNLHLLLPAVLLPAKLLEETARAVRLPGVVGAIVAGVILGPALLGVVPAESRDPAGYDVVQALAQIGLCVLLFRIGLETRVADFVRVWRSATGVAVVGMVLPFVSGWTVAHLWGWSQQTGMFLGATLTATSISVTASALAELRAERTTEGMVILGAAILDDVLGLLLLSALVAVVTPTLSVTAQVFQALVQALAFIAGGLFLGPYVVQAVIWLSRWSKSTGTLLVLAFSYFLLLAYGARAVGLDMIIGAYAAGLAFARHPDRRQLEVDLRPLVELLTPLFFVLLGTSVEPFTLNVFSPAGRQAWGFVALLFVVGVLSKLFSAAWLRKDRINRWVIGSGMMPRGEVGFVFAQIGLTAGIFSADLFSSIILVLIATTIVGPIVLRTTSTFERSLRHA